VATIGCINYFQTFRFTNFTKILYWFCAVLITIAFSLIGLMKFLKDPIIKSGLIQDDFAVQNLQADVYWTGFEFIIGLIFLVGSYLVYISLSQQKIKLLYFGLLLNLIFIILSILVIVPKIEQYSQHAAIEFYKKCAKEKCYVETHNFKSYAYLFYSDRKPDDYLNANQNEYIEKQLDQMLKEGHSRIKSYATANLMWMERGIIDRPAYIVCKTKDESEMNGLTQIHKLYSKNGFSFYVRIPVN